MSGHPVGSGERRSRFGISLSDRHSARWRWSAAGAHGVAFSTFETLWSGWGLPMEALFWWAEYAEYCEWRIPEAGFPRRIVDAAVVHHDAIRQGGDIPTWKYYYESRNTVYYHLHVMRRVGRFPKKIVSLVLRALVRQKNDRIGCLAAICRGLYDGAFSHLGIRYEVSSLHERPLQSTEPA